MLKVSLTAALSLAFTTSLAPAGPFGFELDSFNPESYDCAQIQGSFYRCANPPKKHPDIERYIVQFIPGIGACFIKGISVDISDSRYGYNTRSAIDGIYDQLKGKYGDAEKFDFLRSGSVWDEPEDWMMGLTEDERVYAYMWKLPSPIDGISSLGIFANGLGSDTAFWSVEFSTPKSATCDATDAKNEADAF